MRSLCSIALASVALALSGCGGGPLGANRNAPDEFSILTKPRLTVPPDFALRPPRPGETRPQELSTSQRTQQLLLGDTQAAPPSNGELALIQSAGAMDVDPSIRGLLSAENGGRAQKNESLANRVLFWQVRNNEVDDQQARLIVDNREEWLNARQKSVERVIGPGAVVTIATDDKDVLALPGVQ
ncbi:MAG: DUF3035 domain-containing protein [Pseudomonadota bacterium]